MLQGEGQLEGESYSSEVDGTENEEQTPMMQVTSPSAKEET